MCRTGGAQTPPDRIDFRLLKTDWSCILTAALLQRVTRRARCGRGAADVVALELSVERGAADAQHPSRESLVALHLLKDALDRGAFDVFEVRCR